MKRQHQILKMRRGKQRSEDEMNQKSIVGKKESNRENKDKETDDESIQQRINHSSDTKIEKLQLVQWSDKLITRTWLSKRCFSSRKKTMATS